MDIYQFISDNINESHIFFEIGSHYGIDTQKIYNLTKSKIHCFEPDPRNIRIMEKNGLAELVETINQVAISDSEGVSEFYLSSGKAPEFFSNHDLNVNPWSASNSLKKPKKHLEKTPWCRFDQKIEVRCIKLDSYCFEKNIQKIDFIWMDVQGAEDLVIKGLTEMRPKTRFIFTEYSNEELYENSPNKESILNLLGEDWRIIHDFGTDLLLENNKFDIC